jgi:hypothetical protein
MIVRKPGLQLDQGDVGLLRHLSALQANAQTTSQTQDIDASSENALWSSRNFTADGMAQPSMPP